MARIATDGAQTELEADRKNVRDDVLFGHCGAFRDADKELAALLGSVKDKVSELRGRRRAAKREVDERIRKRLGEKAEQPGTYEFLVNEEVLVTVYVKKTKALRKPAGFSLRLDIGENGV